MSTANASPQDEEAWTVGRLLGWTTDFLKRHGSESPRLEAEILLAHALDWPRVKLYMNINEEVGGMGRSLFRSLVKKRAAGEPVAWNKTGKTGPSPIFKKASHLVVGDAETGPLAAAEFRAQRGGRGVPQLVRWPFRFDPGEASGPRMP